MSNLNQLPPQLLQRALLGQVPEIKPFSALAELDRRNKAAQMSQGIAQQKAMQTPMPPTVIQQVLAQSGGIGQAMPQGYSGGGIVAFAEGGNVDEDLDAQDRKAIYDLEGKINSFDEAATERELRRKKEIQDREAQRNPLYEAQRAEIQRRRALAEQMQAEAKARREAALQRRQFDPTGAGNLAAMASAASGQKRLGGALAAMASALAKNKEANQSDVESMQEKAAQEDATMAKAEDARRDLENAINERAYAASIGDQDAVAAAEEKIAAARQKLLMSQRDAVTARIKDRQNNKLAEAAAKNAEANLRRAAAAERRAENVGSGQGDAVKWQAQVTNAGKAVDKALESQEYKMLALTDKPNAAGIKPNAERVKLQLMRRYYGGIPTEYLPPDVAEMLRGSNNTNTLPTAPKDVTSQFQGFSARRVN